jgi:hypothetical protein
MFVSVFTQTVFDTGFYPKSQSTSCRLVSSGTVLMSRIKLLYLKYLHNILCCYVCGYGSSVFWSVMRLIPIGTDDSYESAGRNFRPQFYENKLNLNFEDGGTKFLRNVSTYLDNPVSLKKFFALARLKVDCVFL